ncbi:MAG TPA: ABC transporter permease [Actinobacteria bacterium]|nr:ABC transporter permease [Actinomycetota bacterium]
MKMIKAIARKEFIHVIRDPRTLIIILILPLFQLLMFGYALSFDIDNIPTGVYDSDRTATSRKLVDNFSSSGYFNITARPAQADFAERLDDGSIKVAIVIPQGFEEDLLSDEKAKLQVIVDGSDPTLARVGVGYSSAIIGRFSSKVTAESLYRRGVDISRSQVPIQASSRVWYNPELRSVNYIVPGLIALILMTVTTITISLAIVREKEKGTLENLIISPIKSWELILGKIAPYVLIAFVEALLITATGMLWFNVPMNGSLLLLFLGLVIYVAGTLGLGLVISAATDSQQVASFAAFMATFLPSFLLSGFVFPIKSMPLVLQFLTYLVPARYFIVVVRGIFLKGTGLSVLWPDFLALAAFAALTIIVASLRLRRAFA